MVIPTTIAIDREAADIEVVIEQLSSLVQIDETTHYKRNVFTAQDSWTDLNTMDQSGNVLTLQFGGMNGIPDLLYSHQIYEDEKSIGINMPVDKLLDITSSTIVLIGVSG
ncbi:hypothetical protein HDU76_011279 [Blyttiomyces sp. JEL0837]|nr:hypothetical protein HDU76_011279 [Blyttiomyces sp. JEL0837]